MNPEEGAKDRAEAQAKAAVKVKQVKKSKEDAE